MHPLRIDYRGSVHHSEQDTRGHDEVRLCKFFIEAAQRECKAAFREDLLWPERPICSSHALRLFVNKNLLDFNEPLPTDVALHALTRLYNSLHCLIFTKSTLSSADGKAIWDTLRTLCDRCVSKLNTRCRELLEAKNFDALNVFIDTYGYLNFSFDHLTQDVGSNRILYCMLTCFEDAYNQMTSVKERLQLFVSLARLYGYTPLLENNAVRDPKEFVMRMMKDVAQYESLDPNQLDDEARQFLNQLGMQDGRMIFFGLDTDKYFSDFRDTKWLARTIETYAPDTPTDITLLLKDGSKIKAHLAVLSRGTAGMLSYFRMPGPPLWLDELDLSRFEPPDVRKIVRHLYGLPIDGLRAYDVYTRVNAELVAYLFGIDVKDLASQCHILPPSEKDAISDLEIRCRDAFIYVHRVIVCHRLGKTVPDMSAVPASDAMVLMRFLYTDTVEFDEVELLLELVKKLNLPKLEKQIHAKLHEAIDQIYSANSLHYDDPEKTVAKVHKCIATCENLGLSDLAARASAELEKVKDGWQQNDYIIKNDQFKIGQQWHVMRTLEVLQDERAVEARKGLTLELLRKPRFSRFPDHLSLPESACEKVISFKGHQLLQSEQIALLAYLKANPMLQLDLSETNIGEDFINSLLDIHFPLGHIRLEGCMNISPVVMKLIHMITPEPEAIQSPTPLMIRLARLGTAETQKLFDVYQELEEDPE